MCNFNCQLWWKLRSHFEMSKFYVRFMAVNVLCMCVYADILVK